MNKLLVSKTNIAKKKKVKVAKFETPNFHNMKRPDLSKNSVNDISRKTRSMVSSALDKSGFDLDDRSLDGVVEDRKYTGMGGMGS